jgi:hypothetical protein
MRTDEAIVRSGIVFVSWGGHWFAAPEDWATNLKTVGLVVVDTLPPVADAEDSTAPR